MANDGSMATLTEDWIVAQIAAITEFANATVEPYPGSLSDDGAKVVAQLLANRDLYAAVLFDRDNNVDLEEGDNGYNASYYILVAVQNQREFGPRRGDGTTIGTNLVRDLLRIALHNKQPGIEANGFYADDTEFRGMTTVYERADAFVVRAEMTVRESPVALAGI